MDNFDRFFENAMSALEATKNSQMDAVDAASALMIESMENNGIIQMIGVDHGRSMGLELGHRAGGLVPLHDFRSEDLAVKGLITSEQYQPEVFNNTPEFASLWLNYYPVDPADLFILTSRTGDEPVLNEMARLIKNNGHKIIVVTSKAAAAKAKAANPEQSNLTDYADLVLDTCTPENDGLVEMKNGEVTGQLNTLANDMLAQLITARIYQTLTDSGKECPLLLSVNIKGADEHNAVIKAPYSKRCIH